MYLSKYRIHLLTAIYTALPLCMQPHTASAADGSARIENPTENIEADFEGIITEIEGGAIYNTIEAGDGGINIFGNFRFNQGYVQGGAIYNSGSLNTISGKFIENYAKVPYPSKLSTFSMGGGAIYNSGQINNIFDSTFEGNYASNKTTRTETGERQGGDAYAYGGAIFNTGTIGTKDAEDSGIINATFKDNYAGESGGAIFNHTDGEIVTISGLFEHNYVANSTRGEDGGAIYNMGKIGTIAADFKENFVKNPSGGLTGGAIYNSGEITSIQGAYEKNYLDNTKTDAKGGAIYNKGTITEISGTFRENYAKSLGNTFGGAICSFNGKITTINADFVGNYVSSTTTFTSESTYGGAIYGYNIEAINGDFTDNYAKSTLHAYGGAIYGPLSGKIGTESSGITGNFRGNYVESENGTARGGAICSYGRLTDITGDFTNNYVSTKSGIIDNAAYGGAIATTNYEVGHIRGDFIGNHAQAESSYAFGGAIYLYSDLAKSIAGSFISNYASSTGAFARGGAIYNISILSGLAGKSFTNNYAHSHADIALGGAVFNHSYGAIPEISGDFVGNFARSDSSYARGGAIYNVGEMNEIINSSFIGNYAQGNEESLGGAIYTDRDLKIIADAEASTVGNGGHVLFQGNWAGSADNPQALYIDKEDAKLTLEARGKGQIIFDDKIGTPSDYELELTGDTVESIIELNHEVDHAHATLNHVTLKIGLTAENKSDVFANAILDIQSGQVDTVDHKYGTYTFKELTSSPDARYQVDAALIDGKECNDVFDVTHTTASGIITLSGIAMNIFEEVADSAPSDRSYIFQIIKGAVDGNLQLTFENALKAVDYATAHMTSDDILAAYFQLYTKDSLNDSVEIVGWRDNLASWAELEVEQEESKSFTINTGDTQCLTRDIDELRGQDLTIRGLSGNILSLGEHNLLDHIAEEQTVSLHNLDIEATISKNIENQGKLNLESVALSSHFSIENNGELNIAGAMELKSDITSRSPMSNKLIISDKGKVTGDIVQTEIHITSAISNQNIIHEATTSSWTNADDYTYSTATHLQATEASLGRQSRSTGKETAQFANFRDNSLTMNGGIFYLHDMDKTSLQLRDLHLNKGAIHINSTNVYLDQETMGGIRVSGAADYTPGGQSIIWLGALNIVTDSAQKITHVRFVDERIGSAVQDGHGIAGAQPDTVFEVQGPKWTYEVTYNNTDLGGGEGVYTFSRNGVTPAVMAPTVAQHAALAHMMLIYDYAFMHADLYADSVYQGGKNRGYTMVTPAKATKEYTPTRHKRRGSTASYTQQYTPIQGGMWLRPYATFESIPLRHGPKVDTSLYGALVGYDTDLTEHANGWASVFSGYLGYNGSQQTWEDNNRTRQNGARVGLTETLYKKNFYTALTLSAGVSHGETHTDFGKEDFDMQMAGIAIRSGYNLCMASGKYVIQPSLQLSYTTFHVNDYDNAAGIRMEADPMHAIQINPSVKFIKHAKKEWTPYLTGGFVWNLMSKTHISADGDKLPELSIRPYAEYGVGLQKTWKSRYTAHGQLTGRSGGRNGVEASVGLRCIW